MNWLVTVCMAGSVASGGGFFCQSAWAQCLWDP